MEKIYFVGAGPGDPELITVKGLRLLRAADLVLYAGSLVSLELVAEAKVEAEVLDSSKMTLEQTHALLSGCARRGGLAVRLHTGDPSLYGAVREQVALLDAEGLAWEIVPGVTAAFAAAAAAGVSFTVPERTQSLVITRLAGRTPVPEAESLRHFAAHGASMAVYLSAASAGAMADELLAGGLDPATPVVLAHRVGWPGEVVLKTRLDETAARHREEGAGRQTVFLVLPGELDNTAARSRLYDPEFAHGFRPAREAIGDGADDRVDPAEPVRPDQEASWKR